MNERKYFLEFVCNDKPWSTNDDRKLNQYERHEKIQHWKLLAQLKWKSVPGVPQNIGRSLVRVRIPVIDNRRRDPANYCGTVGKAIIDGLVAAKVWPDDTPEYVMHLEPILEVRKDKVVSIEIWLLEELDFTVRSLLWPTSAPH